MENKLEKLPAFAWWVPYVIKKRNRIIKKLKKKIGHALTSMEYKLLRR